MTTTVLKNDSERESEPIVTTGEIENNPLAEGLKDFQLTPEKPAEDTTETAEETRSEVKDATVIPINKDAEASEESTKEVVEESKDQLSELITHIESLTTLKEAFDLRSNLFSKGLVGRKFNNGKKELVAKKGVKGGEKIVKALKETFKRLHLSQAKEKAAEKRMQNLITDIKKAKSSSEISKIAHKANEIVTNRLKNMRKKLQLKLKKFTLKKLVLQ